MSNSMNVIQHNMSAMFTDRQLGITTNTKAKSSEKLSSGYRINRAADDAAGLSMSEKMRRQIRGLTQASKNLQDGVSLAQVADGYLAEVHDMLQRVNELSVKAANGTLHDVDREYVDNEVQSLKEEMERIFDTANFNEIPLFHMPYTPNIKLVPEVNDFCVFHAGNSDSAPGGLQFNNVRYSIEELQKMGMKIDDRGVATEDITKFSFKLWDGEEVALNLAKGADLNSAERVYGWGADENGILINNKLACRWENLKLGEEKIGNIDTFQAGTYKFIYHGMEVSFSIGETSEKIKVIEGIAGDGATIGATWDVSAATATELDVASIMNGGSTQVVNADNMRYIDHSFRVTATPQGLTVSHASKNPSRSEITGGDKKGVTGEIVEWKTFRDVSKASGVTDPDSGTGIETNGGYPIVDWGLDQDNNDKSQITYDDTAKYSFRNTDPNVRINYDFQLAETTSRAEVIDAMDGTPIDSRISAPGGFLNTANAYASDNKPIIRASDQSNVKITNDRLNDTFDLQRALGRTFTTDSDQITGSVTWTRTDATAIGNFNTNDANRANAHSTKDNDAFTAVGSSSHRFYVKETTTDGSGNPVVQYYAVTAQDYAQDYQNTWDQEWTWSENATYRYTGSFGGKEMEPQNGTVTERYGKTVGYTQTVTETHTVYSSSVVTDPTLIGLLDAGTLGSAEAADLGAADRNIWDHLGDRMDTQYTYGQRIPDHTGAPADLWQDPEKTYKGVTGMTHAVTFRIAGNAGELTDSVFTFEHSINTAGNQNVISNGGSGSVDLTWQANGKANVSFYARDPSKKTKENDYTRVRLNVPLKGLDIQSGSEWNHQIRMEWSPLNLSIIGMSGTHTRTQESAQSAIDDVKYALNLISETRSLFGAYQNRFEHAIRLTDNVVENTQRAESEIRDTNMADEMVRFSNASIIQQAGQSMLAQANQSKQGIISFLQ